MQSIHLRVAGRTDIGRVRRNNQDSFVVADLTGGNLLDPAQPVARIDVRDKGVLLAVSDGMGGHAAGDLASALVVESVTRALAQARPSAPTEVKVKEAVQQAHNVVRQAGREEGHKGMGATLTALLVKGDTAYTAEVGDSRAYLVRGGSIARLTHDQNYVQLLLDSGAIRPEEAEQSPMRHILLQAMGSSRSALSVELGKLELRDRDCLVLCSDGLTKAATDDEIRTTVLGTPRLDEACSRLVDLANQRGGEDNVTVIVAGVAGEIPPPKEQEQIGSTFEILESFDPKKQVERG